MNNTQILTRPSSLTWTHAIFCITYLQSMFLLSHGLPLDRYVSDLFFNPHCTAENVRQCWLFDKTDKGLSFFLHDLPVHVFTTISIIALVIFLVGFVRRRFAKYRSLSFLTLIGIAFVPGIISLLKTYTGHYCPGQLAAYGGPIGLDQLTHIRPRCFPAGFPSPFFGLIILYFGALPLIWRRIGLYAGLGFGSISSIIQIARGEHFLSHCLATLITTLFVAGLIYFYNEYRIGRLYEAPGR